jgi:formate dehydrogenase iron-sulfur subunit
MSATVYVPKDAGALSLGAEEVARAIDAEAQRRGTPVQIVRNGSRGAYWLEPMVEVLTPAGRMAYGPVSASDVASLFDASFLGGGSHPLGHGATDSMEWLRGQQRLTFQRVGIVNPASVEDYVKYGGYQGLKRALGMAPEQIVQAITASGLRGRGGAAFPTGIKWKTVYDQQTAQKYVTCNADEGDSGTFADRMLMEGDPLTLVEGMTIAGVAVGATQGYIYLRAEYPHAYAALNTAIRAAHAAGYLGCDVAGSGKRFELEVRLGAGAYICGEETSMLESLEGKRGEIRVRPPLPAIKGLFGQPTIVNNVVTLSTVPWILANGAEAYAGFGMGKSRGTLPIQLAGNIRRGGLVERAFGLTLKELLYDYGGGTASGRPIRTVQVGGPLGAYMPPAHFDTAVDYEALSSVGALLGHGGIVVFDDTVDMARMARYAMEFCALESCGKCTPCRIGSTRGVEVLDRILAGVDGERNVQLLEQLCEVMVQGSLCGLGGMAPFPVQSALKHFREDFRARSN